ncbi:hypothetical protein [Occultella gossypii]|uniref:Uncharacterized protein n=1 Tax=Occultella gossypii TaxID=2800820 RepID=A0ABS7SGJ8_9MICO|nr:hypothetical protein [Occultella gossypii]MBZ2199485.1 hypothetical protein [Occultella gossypii]
MTWTEKIPPFLAGVLLANSVPHLGTAVTGRTHLTPIAGSESSPAVNLAWGAANAIGGLTLLRAGSRPGGGAWDRRLIAFELGAAVFSVWMVASEAVLHVNTPAAR